MFEIGLWATGAFLILAAIYLILASFLKGP